MRRFGEMFFRHLFTGIDGKSYDLGRVLWFFGAMTLMVYQGVDLYHGHEFHPIDFATGVAAVLAGGGAGLGFKAATEPPMVPAPPLPPVNVTVTAV